MKLTKYPIITAALTSLGIATGMRLENLRQGDRIPQETIQKAALQEDMFKLNYRLIGGNKIEYAEILIKEPDELGKQWHHARIMLTPDGKKLLEEMSKKFPKDAIHIE